METTEDLLLAKRARGVRFKLGIILAYSGIKCNMHVKQKTGAIAEENHNLNNCDFEAVAAFSENMYFLLFFNI